MLNPNEKKEMVSDARCPDRRESFRKMRIKSSDLSFDDYLRFLSKVQDAFTKAAEHVQNPPHSKFKL